MPARVRWWAHLTAGTVALTVIQLCWPRAGWLWLVPQTAGVVLGLAALRGVRPQARLGWLLLLAARVAAVLLSAWWAVRVGQGDPVSPRELGLGNAPMYALFAAAAVRLTRRHRSAGGLESGFEAGAVVVALAMLAWSLVVEPYLGRPGYQQVDNGVAVLYSIFDLAILAGVLRALFTAPRGPARLVGAGGAALLAAHLYYAATGAAGAGQFLPGGVSFLLLQLWGVLLTSAALHPGAAALGAPPDDAPAPLNRHRLVGILLTAVLSPYLPLIAAARAGRPVTAVTVVPAVLVSALCGLLFGRVWVLAAIGQRRARRLDRQTAELRHALHEQSVLQDQLAYRAGHDTRTGLANRDLFAERLAAAGNGHAVLLCGLDGFKAVNDAYGHGVGDEVLRRLAGRLRACSGPGDLAARLGGDEFGVLLAGGAGRARELAEAIRSALAEPVVVGDRRIHVTAGIGLADGPALGDADLALQAAKRAGRQQIAHYDAGLRAEQTERAEIAEGLRQALTDGSLHLAYQPVADPATGRTVAVEALMRWRRAGEPVSPAQFIPVAEQTGLIGALGELALRDACREAARWHARHGLYVTVNVSSHQLQEPSFTGTVLDALHETGLPASALVLEITESVLIDADDAETHLRRLREHGVRIAIDDFGTGYSSLAYLHQLPVDILKIDQTFVRRSDGPAGVGLLRATLEIARSQGLIAVAEGVETADQADLLLRLGCPLVQGYYFARPLTPEAIDARLAAESAAAA